MYSNVIKEIGKLTAVPIRCNGNSGWSQGEEIMKAFDEVRNNVDYSYILLQIEHFVCNSPGELREMLF